MLRWADPVGELLQLPPVAVLTLHFVLVFLSTKLRCKGRAHASTPPYTAPSSLEGEDKATGAAASAAASAAAAAAAGVAAAPPPRVATGGDCDGAGTVGLARARVSGRGALSGGVSGAGGGGGAGGRVASTHLGDVPSHVFDVVLPSDPAFDAEVGRTDHSDRS